MKAALLALALRCWCAMHSQWFKSRWAVKRVMPSSSMSALRNAGKSGRAAK
jgi:hypothetical protein